MSNQEFTYIHRATLYLLHCSSMFTTESLHILQWIVHLDIHHASVYHRIFALIALNFSPISTVQAATTGLETAIPGIGNFFKRGRFDSTPPLFFWKSEMHWQQYFELLSHCVHKVMFNLYVFTFFCVHTFTVSFSVFPYHIFLCVLTFSCIHIFVLFFSVFSYHIFL